MNTVELPIFKFNSQWLGVTALASIDTQKEAAREVLYRAKVRVCGEAQDPYTYQTYDSWWQQFKAQCFPKWLRLRFPPKTTTHTVDIKVLYPYLKSSIPTDLRGPLFTLCVADHTTAIWSDEPMEPFALMNRLCKDPMFDMTIQRCQHCGASFDRLFKR